MIIKMQNKLLIGVILILIQFNYCILYAQLPDPIKRSSTEYGIINSDYGPRYFTTSTFHNGIDYKCGLGEKAYSVEAGDITDFGQWGTGISYIMDFTTMNPAIPTVS